VPVETPAPAPAPTPTPTPTPAPAATEPPPPPQYQTLGKPEREEAEGDWDPWEHVRGNRHEGFFFLKHRRLGLGRRPVDFVGENHVGEDRPLEEPELALARNRILKNHLGARDVAGHQVRRELNALERQVQRLRQGRYQQRFGETRHADQQGVAAGQNGDEHLLDDLFLADDDLAQFGFDPGARGFQEFNRPLVLVRGLHGGFGGSQFAQRFNPLHAVRSGSHLLHGRQEQTNQNGDDRNHHQQLDQCKRMEHFGTIFGIRQFYLVLLLQ
jgi:hypothetical protein